MTNYEKVRQMHEKYWPESLGVVPTDEMMQKRLGIIQEELSELKQAVGDKDAEGIMKELADVLYSAYGMCVEMGFDIDEAFDRVHKSNMSKDRPANSSEKLIKGPDYKPADLADLVQNFRFRE
jgi:predicted HAD superfamily Cof-like phosphohydrolase